MHEMWSSQVAFLLYPASLFHQGVHLPSNPVTPFKINSSFSYQQFFLQVLHHILCAPIHQLYPTTSSIDRQYKILVGRFIQTRTLFQLLGSNKYNLPFTGGLMIIVLRTNSTRFGVLLIHHGCHSIAIENVTTDFLFVWEKVHVTK